MIAVDGICRDTRINNADDDRLWLLACGNGVYDALDMSRGDLSLVFGDRLCTWYCSLRILQP